MGKIIDTGNYAFPTMCIDNFWSNPDKVVSLALSQDFSESHSSYPGFRTKELGDILPEFNEIMINKIISLFIDIDKYQNFNIVTKHFFQKISPLSDDPISNIGMVHQDSGAYEDAPGDILSCIVYLNKNSKLDAGTSIFKEKYPNSDYSWYNKNNNQNVILHNNKFIETIKFQNIYNRLVVFDSMNPHAANLFDGGNEDRLTQVFFIKSISFLNKMPNNRMRFYNEK